MIRKLWPSLLLNVAAAGYGLTVWHRLPDRVVTHWGINGEPNGWSSSTLLIVMVPAIALAMAIILAYVPRVDPKYRNFPMHADAYWLVANAVLTLLAVVHVIVLGSNLGWNINMSNAVVVCLGVMFLILGNVLTRVRQNWIFGIRTPWTLSSERSWRETHRVGGYGFVLCGLVGLTAACIAPTHAVMVILGATLINTLLVVVWSYIAWKRDPAVHGENQ